MEFHNKIKYILHAQLQESTDKSKIKRGVRQRDVTQTTYTGTERFLQTYRVGRHVFKHCMRTLTSLKIYRRVCDRSDQDQCRGVEIS